MAKPSDQTSKAEEDLADVSAYAAVADLAAGGASPLPAELPPPAPEIQEPLGGGETMARDVPGGARGEVGIGPGYLLDLETKRRKGLAWTMERLTAGLDVPVAWIG